VLGIDLHRDATVAREESQSLAAALDRRAKDRRRWRGVSLAAVVLIALSAFSLRKGVGHNEITWPLEQRCAGYDLGACNKLGDLLAEFGQKDVLRDDRQHAATLYQRACQGGFAQACVNLGHLYLDASTPQLRDPRAAKRWLTQACDFGRQDACTQLTSDADLRGY
jgi:TPR repeat protein